VMPASYQPMAIMNMVPGGFITLGLMMIVINAIKKMAAGRGRREEGLA